jgi:hypothetical protein
MKRYRVLAFDFDARANILNQEIGDKWEPNVKAMWEQNKQQIIDGLAAEYGPTGLHEKVENFKSIGAMPISLIAFHNKFFRQARSAFVIGAYYPSLTAFCALGERVLNHLVILFRDDFKGSKEYKHVYRKDSFDNWDLAIDTLESWEILLPKTVQSFKLLRNLRNKTLHFNPDTDANDRAMAFEANKLFTEIVNEQFSGFGLQPWYIEGTKGAMFVKKNYENRPFVNKVVLSNCQLVGFMHQLEARKGQWIVLDNHKYEDRHVSDQEFRDLFNNRPASN